MKIIVDFADMDIWNTNIEYRYKYIWIVVMNLMNLLPNKKICYSNLHLENISRFGYKSAIKVWNTVEMKNSGDNHQLTAQSEFLLFIDMFENLRDTCLKNIKQ